MRKVLPVLALLLVPASPITVEEGTLLTRAVLERQPRSEPRALAEFKARLIADGRARDQHGVYVETLEGAEPIAALNDQAIFNPASLIKLATSLAALDQLGANYRFRTELRAGGDLDDPRTGELAGDLIVVSGGDPSFSLPDARDVGDGLRRLGIRRVSGSLVVIGAFTCNHNSQTAVSAGVFRRHCRLPIHGATRYESPPSGGAPGRLLLAIESDTLIRILQEQNAHSVNAMADMLGHYIGGPEAVKRFLVERLRLPAEAIYLTHASGLDVNRLTPRAMVKVLRALVRYLSEQGYAPESVMPVAGIDAGTLRDRFADEEFAGSVIAKTGTLHDTDGGVAALAGIALTRGRGPLLFAICDMAEGRQVLRLRRLQDEFLKELMLECGGPAPLSNRAERTTAWAPESRLIFAQ
jgi:D-alanyl-D-alanine carboxypeptidase/D-alanyl-D-alanine-endopeptidase (penicillin-binding protein 4)